MTHVDRRRGREPEVAAHALPILATADRRRRARRPEGAVLGLPLDDARRPGRDRPRPCARETELAATTDDGHRAWVIRDTLAKLDPAVAERAPHPPRRHPPPAGRASTSGAPPTAARFGGARRIRAACPSHPRST